MSFFKKLTNVLTLGLAGSLFKGLTKKEKVNIPLPALPPKAATPAPNAIMDTGQDVALGSTGFGTTPGIKNERVSSRAIVRKKKPTILGNTPKSGLNI